MDHAIGAVFASLGAAALLLIPARPSSAQEVTDLERGAGDGREARIEASAYDATGEIPCSMGGGRPTRACPFGVERVGGGSGIVRITRPDGRTRTLFFEDGHATGSDASGVEGGEFRTTREGDRSIVRVGSERYVIPDAVLFE